jgi:hypothetical protein
MSTDLTASDFFLWGYLKAQVYATKPRNVQELKEGIIVTVREINVPLLERVMGDFFRRLHECVRRQETTGMVVTTLMAVVLRCGRKRETTTLSSQVSAALTNHDVT